MSDPNYGYSGGQAGFPGHGDSDLFNDQLLPVQYGSFWERFAAILIDGLIIAVAGAVLWMLIQDKPFTTTNIILLVLLLVLTGLGLTDVMPKPIRQDIIAKYSIKAWPCIGVWVMISWELLFKDFVGGKAIEEEGLVLNNGYARP